MSRGQSRGKDTELESENRASEACRLGELTGHYAGMEGLASRGTWRTCRGMHVEGGEVGSGETEELIPRTNMLRRGDG